MIRIWIHLRNHDLGMVRDLHPLVVIQQLFVQLLPFSQAGKLNLNVLPYLFARKLNHALRQVHNLHRTAHIKNIHFPSIPHDPCFQYQLAGFGDGHEVARDVGVGHRQKASIRELLLEERNYRSIRTQDISKRVVMKRVWNFVWLVSKYSLKDCTYISAARLVAQRASRKLHAIQAIISENGVTVQVSSELFVNLAF